MMRSLSCAQTVMATPCCSTRAEHPRSRPQSALGPCASRGHAVDGASLYPRSSSHLTIAAIVRLCFGAPPRLRLTAAGPLPLMLAPQLRETLSLDCMRAGRLLDGWCAGVERGLGSPRRPRPVSSQVLSLYRRSVVIDKFASRGAFFLSACLRRVVFGVGAGARTWPLAGLACTRGEPLHTVSLRAGPHARPASPVGGRVGRVRCSPAIAIGKSVIM